MHLGFWATIEPLSNRSPRPDQVKSRRLETIGSSGGRGALDGKFQLSLRTNDLGLLRMPFLWIRYGC